MPVLKKGSGVEDGLQGMSSILQGALHAEQTNYARDVQERDYQLNVDKFDESTRQFDVSMEESVRQFETNMAWNTEQNSLSRQHQADLQDDAQEQQTFIQDDQQEFATVENKRDRACLLYTSPSPRDRG